MHITYNAHKQGETKMTIANIIVSKGIRHFAYWKTI